MNFIKNILLELLEKEIKLIKEEHYAWGHHTGKRDAQVEKEEERQRIEISIMEDSIGRKVIYCSNEWEDPLFGIITGVATFTRAGNAMYVVQNVLTKQTHYCFNGTLHCSDEKMVDAILKLNPFERWNMNLAKGYLAPNMWEKSYPPIKGPTDPALLKQKLKDANFI